MIEYDVVYTPEEREAQRLENALRKNEWEYCRNYSWDTECVLSNKPIGFLKKAYRTTMSPWPWTDNEKEIWVSVDEFLLYKLKNNV